MTQPSAASPVERPDRWDPAAHTSPGAAADPHRDRPGRHHPADPGLSRRDPHRPATHHRRRTADRSAAAAADTASWQPVGATARGCSRSVGLPVAEDALRVALDLDSDAPAAGMDWLQDFTTAEQAGMALRVTWTRHGWTGCWCSGSGTTWTRQPPRRPSPTCCRARDDVRFVASGEATNQVAPSESGAAAAGTVDTSGMETTGPTAAARLSAALGVPAGAFDPLDGAKAGEDQIAAAMNAALWPATWGYYLAHRLGGPNGVGVGPADLERGRRAFIDHVRADGPLPTLRIGDQPYGFLPTTTLDSWVGAGEPLGAARRRPAPQGPQRLVDRGRRTAHGRGRPGRPPRGAAELTDHLGDRGSHADGSALRGQPAALRRHAGVGGVDGATGPTGHGRTACDRSRLDAAGRAFGLRARRLRAARAVRRGHLPGVPRHARSARPDRSASDQHRPAVHPDGIGAGRDRQVCRRNAPMRTPPGSRPRRASCSDSGWRASCRWC